MATRKPSQPIASASGFKIDGRDAGDDSSSQKIEALSRRCKALETQRDEALAQLEGARRGAKVAPTRPSNGRVRNQRDIVRIAFGDLHGLHADKAAFAAVLADIKRFRPHEIVLGGDMINCGGFLAQHHTLGYVAETEETYEEDVATTNAHLDAIQQAGRGARILYIEGNHEDRVERWAVTQTLRHRKDSEFLRRLVSPQYLLQLKRRGIEYFRRSEHYDGISIPGWIKRGKIFFTHAISGARHAASAAVSNAGGNVVYFHTHRPDFSALVLPNVGLVAAWNPGCLCRRQPLWRNTAPTHWAHGYAVQLVAPSGNFQHVNVLIENGVSLVGSLLG